MLGKLADNLQGRTHITTENGFHQRLEERQALLDFIRLQMQGHKVSPLHGRLHIDQHIFHEDIAGERIDMLQKAKAEGKENIVVALLRRHLQPVNQLNERIQVFFAHHLNGLANHQPQQHLHDFIQAAHMGFGHFFHYCPAARQDIDQLAPLQDQQCLADGAAAHIQIRIVKFTPIGPSTKSIDHDREPTLPHDARRDCIPDQIHLTFLTRNRR